MATKANRERQDLVELAIHAVGWAIVYRDEDDEEGMRNLNREASDLCARIGVSHTNREWEDVLDDLHAMHERLEYAR